MPKLLVDLLGKYAIYTFMYELDYTVLEIFTTLQVVQFGALQEQLRICYLVYNLWKSKVCLHFDIRALSYKYDCGILKQYRRGGWEAGEAEGTF